MKKTDKKTYSKPSLEKREKISTVVSSTSSGIITVPAGPVGSIIGD